MHELGLFAGSGGGLLASRLLGWHTVCAVEIEPYCQRVLEQRQRDGHLDPFPIWDDIRTFDGRPWHGHVDVVSGGFPCQDISSAGGGAGLSGARSGLWFDMLRVVGEVRPTYVFAENSPMLRTRGLDVVLSGLADLGYVCVWGVLGADHAGAPHGRRRLWLCGKLADASQGNGARQYLANSPEPGSVGRRQARGPFDPAHLAARNGQVWSLSTDVESGVADGLANRLDRLCALGNGQVPAVAALAWHTLSALF